MKRVSALTVLILILALSAQPAAAITFGELDGDRHPNVGLMVADVDGVPTWLCSGTLIAPRVFLTAGHCVGDDITGARVWFGADLTDVPDFPAGGVVAIEGTPIPHPLYASSASDLHDVGVVILDEPVEGIQPATLATPGLLTQLKASGVLKSGPEEGVFFRSVGYGDQLVAWPHPTYDWDLQRRVSESEFVSLTKVNLHLWQRAVFDESGSCFGDSGGPVFWDDPDGNEILVAVTSTGDGACVATGFDYRIDQPEILAWIQGHIE